MMFVSHNHVLRLKSHARDRLRGGFTLVELLVVVGVIATLSSFMLPALSAARGQSQEIVCKSNIRQLAIANIMYAQENRGFLCPASIDLDTGNLHRWHGVRNAIADRFDPARGMLVPYLGTGAEIKECPTFRRFYDASSNQAFERGCGGYGYNKEYLGQRVAGGQVRMESGVFLEHVQRPHETLMFADAAFAEEAAIIEYSFAEPRFWRLLPHVRSNPSIQFRHDRQASIAWADGHVDSHELAYTWHNSFIYPNRQPQNDLIGWFGTEDSNRYFDLE